MKANELRIGNLISKDSKIFEMRSIMPPGVKHNIGVRRLFDNEKFVVTDEFCSGVPLTKEWLLMFGFNKRCKDKKHSILEYYINSFEIIDTSSIFYFHWPNTISIQYVHQLQNLYFALTGEELEVK